MHLEISENVLLFYPNFCQLKMMWWKFFFSDFFFSKDIIPFVGGESNVTIVLNLRNSHYRVFELQSLEFLHKQAYKGRYKNGQNISRNQRRKVSFRCNSYDSKFLKYIPWQIIIWFWCLRWFANSLMKNLWKIRQEG